MEEENNNESSANPNATSGDEKTHVLDRLNNNELYKIHDALENKKMQEQLGAIISQVPHDELVNPYSQDVEPNLVPDYVRERQEIERQEIERQEIERQERLTEAKIDQHNAENSPVENLIPDDLIQGLVENKEKNLREIIDNDPDRLANLARGVIPKEKIDNKVTNSEILADYDMVDAVAAANPTGETKGIQTTEMNELLEAAGVLKKSMVGKIDDVDGQQSEVSENSNLPDVRTTRTSREI